MRAKLLFSFSGTQNDPVKESTNIEIKYESGYQMISCFRKQETPITKELLEEAVEMMHSLKPKKDDIHIRNKELAEKIFLLPKSVSSIVYWDKTINYANDWNNKKLREEMASQSQKGCVDLLQKVPEHVTKVEILTYYKWKDADEVIKAIPKHVTCFTLNADAIKNCTYNELLKFFSSFHNQMKEIHLLGDLNNELAIDDKVLRNLIIKLPFSVKILSVPRDDSSSANHKTERQLNLEQYGKKEYFPKSYFQLTNSSTEVSFQKAKNLLNDYTKNTSWFPGFVLFATFHCNRHHVDAVNVILQKSKSIEDLLGHLNAIEMSKDFNPTGSLARRIHYIKYMRYQEQNNKNTVDQADHITPFGFV